MTTDPITEAVARAIAAENGDKWEELPGDKQDWVARQGHFGGRFRYANEPYRLDYLAMATAAIRALYGALEREGPSEEMIWAMAKNMCWASNNDRHHKGCSCRAVGECKSWDRWIYTSEDVLKDVFAAAPKPPGAG